jgi:hypothetical protein
MKVQDLPAVVIKSVGDDFQCISRHECWSKSQNTGR